MTDRTPAELAAITDLHYDFCRAIDDKKGIDRQTVLDPLEYTLWNLLTECFSDPDSLDAYLDVMRERCHGVWRRHNPE
jgi:hypothetical protein